MKHLSILFAIFLISTMSYGQFQVSVSSGYAIGSAGMKLGEKVTLTDTENTYGSYGEGANIQIRGTYFLNDKFGVDLSFGYLNGTDQTISKGYELDEEGNLNTNVDINAIARARAFGASASMIYKFNNNFYGRIGALLKLGGKTEAVVYKKEVFSDTQAAGLGLPAGSYSETNYIEDFHGHFPLGFVAALGYEFKLNTHFSLLVEAEYYGISLKRKNSKLSEFNTDILLPNGTVAKSNFYSLDDNNLPDDVYKETTYVDNLPHDNKDGSKKLSQKVPYSSFGINFGVTYKFKN